MEEAWIGSTVFIERSKIDLTRFQEERKMESHRENDFGGISKFLWSDVIE